MHGIDTQILAFRAAASVGFTKIKDVAAGQHCLFFVQYNGEIVNVTCAIAKLIGARVVNSGACLCKNLGAPHAVNTATALLEIPKKHVYTA